MTIKKNKYAKGYRFLSFARKYKKQLLVTGLDAVKTTSKKLVHKAGEFIGNKIADTVIKSNNDNTGKREPVEEIIPPKKRDETLKN